MKDTKQITRQTPFEELPELLRIQEVRAYLGLGVNGVSIALKRGELPHRKIGGVIFIPKSSFKELAVA